MPKPQERLQLQEKECRPRTTVICTFNLLRFFHFEVSSVLRKPVRFVGQTHGCVADDWLYLQPVRGISLLLSTRAFKQQSTSTDSGATQKPLWNGLHAMHISLHCSMSRSVLFCHTNSIILGAAALCCVAGSTRATNVPHGKQLSYHKNVVLPAVTLSKVDVCLR